MNWKLLLSLLLAIAVFGGLGWLLSRDSGKLEAPGQIIREAEGTDIPETARSVDGYAFVDESGVYLRSAFSTSTMKIPDARPSSFRVVVPVTEFSNEEILATCTGPGNYSIYADSGTAYLFQFWKTETFASTKIEAVRELDLVKMAQSGAHEVTDGTKTLRIGYTLGTSTCELIPEIS